ncbi:MAG: IPT/TIG domain-containing protein [Candidatus Acidiferrales bacterium]
MNGSGGDLVSSVSVPVGSWTYIVGTSDSSGDLKLYVNGVLNGTSSQTFFNLDSLARPYTLGGHPVYSGFNFNGTIDEARVSNIARSADWIATEYSNQSNPATFYSVGSPSGPSNPVLVSIAVTPANSSVPFGNTQQFAATGTYSDGSTQNLTSTASWSSSTPTVATINSAGLATGVAEGTATIAATFGGFSSSAVLSVAPAVPASIAVSPQNPSIAAGGTQQFTATGIYPDGSTQDLTTSVAWSSSNSSVLWISNTLCTQGIAVGTSTGTASVTATFGGVAATTMVTVVPATVPNPPTITSVTPTTGAAGTQVMITGSGFGASQNGAYVYVGSVLGIVASWSDTQIVATVAPNSTSGIVEVLQGGQQSNSVNFTVFSPTIASISPTSGVAGTSVTITGSGFGAAQGGGQVWLGTATGIVASWSDSQIVATVAASAASGSAQVLQNSVWSNAVPFTINTPQIASVYPASGSPGTSVTIAGSGFGAAQGSGQVWLGSGNGVVTSWCDMQVVATVASGSVSGIVRIQQNGVWSNAVSFTIPSSDGSAPLMLTPNTISMVVGDTHTIEAVNALGQSVTGLAWRSSDTTVVSLSTDDPPVLTALAAGHVTITAGNASADVTVYAGSLPTGTALWSNPGDGSTVTRAVPAVPSASGVDVFAFDASGNVTAVKTDGTTAWTANLTGSSYYSAPIPDFLGGLVVVQNSESQTTLQELDGTTGQLNPPYNYTLPDPSYDNYSSSGRPGTVAVSTDGTIFAVDGDQLVAIDPTTGSAKFTAKMEDGLDTYYPSCENSESDPIGYHKTYPGIYQVLIAGDGYTYVLYEYENQISADLPWPEDCNLNARRYDAHLRVLRVSPAGGTTEIALGDWTESTSTSAYNIDGPSFQNGTIPYVGGSFISNSDSGVLLSWSASSEEYCPDFLASCQDPVPATTTNQLMAITGGSITSNVSTQFPVEPVLQRADGSFIGFADYNMAAFDQSGNIEWSIPGYSPVIATADGGVIATTYNSNGGLITATFDANGNATGQIPNFPTLSWKGAYQLGSVDSVVPPPVTLATTFAAVSGGNLTGNGTALVHHSFGLFWCGTGFAEQGSCSNIGGDDVVFGYVANPSNSNINTLQSFTNTQVGTIEAKALGSFRAAFAKYPIMVSPATDHPNFLGNMVADQEFTAYVVGTWPVPAFGLEFPGAGRSRLYYLAFMGDAQVALGYPEGQGPDCGQSWCDLNPTYPPQPQFVTAIGTAIGNAAAHETGHYLEGVTLPSGGSAFPYMDCGLGDTQASPAPTNCENSNNFVYNFFSGTGYPQDPSNTSSTGGMFFYGIPGGTSGIPVQSPIHWGPSNDCWLRNYAAPGSCKK